MNISSVFSRRSTHLLCPTKTGAKCEKAREWSVPVVDMQWLANIAACGLIDVSEDRIGESSDPHRSPEAQEQSRKGKDRATSHTDHGANANSRYSRHEERPADGIIGTTARSQSRSDHQSAPQSSPFGDGDYLEVGSFGQPVGLLQDTPNHAEDAEDTEPLSACVSTRSLPEGEDRSIEIAMSLAELRQDMQNTRIPSSASPSSIKAPSSSNSPAKISREATKVLQESITSLLGKRISTEDVEFGHSSRPKRPRPPSRAKV